MTVTVLVSVWVEYEIKITLSAFLVNLSVGSALSAAIDAGIPFGKVAIAYVAVHELTSTEADLKSAFRV